VGAIKLWRGCINWAGNERGGLARKKAILQYFYVPLAAKIFDQRLAQTVA
jgi:hypothetical protein